MFEVILIVVVAVIMFYLGFSFGRGTGKSDPQLPRKHDDYEPPHKKYERKRRYGR